MKEIILASASPRRFDLLKQINLNFKVQPSNINEEILLKSDPVDTVKVLAYNKAWDVAQMNKSDNYVVIGADTIVFCGQILGKPRDDKEAFKMLKNLQGKWHEVITGICLIDTGTLQKKISYEKTRVKISELSDESITSYIKTGEPFDKAGGYGIQSKGALIVESIEGCYNNVVGLPLFRLSKMLEKFHIKTL